MPTTATKTSAKASKGASSKPAFGAGKPAHRLKIQRRIVGWPERWIDQPLKVPGSGRP